MTVDFTIAGTEHSFRVVGSSDGIGAQEKKRLRLHILSTLPQGYVPFHAVLLERQGRGTLIVGVSGSGKTTLAKALCAKSGNIVAHDMVVVWQSGTQIYAGDLNFKESNLGKVALPIDEVIFLSPSDPRDFFSPSKKEMCSLYCASLPSLGDSLLVKFTNEDLFLKLIEKSMVLGNRQSVERWEGAFVHKNQKFSRIRVGIIGMGTIGQEVANLLMLFPQMESLHVYSPDAHKLAGLVLDLQSVGIHAVYRHSTIAEILSHSDLVICTFGLKTVCIPYDNGEERMKKFFDHGAILWDISRVIRQAQFKGTMLMVTNPVDSLAWALHRFSNSDDHGALDWRGLYDQQIMGVGLGLDFARLMSITQEKIEVVGEHTDEVIMARSHDGVLIPFEHADIRSALVSYSSRIREHVPRTKFGPAHEIMRVIRSMCGDDVSIMRVSCMDHTGIFLGDVFERRGNIMRRFYDVSSSLEYIREKQRMRQRSYHDDLLSQFFSTSSDRLKVNSILS